MTASNSIPASWQQWLQENIERKVPEHALIEVMVKANFDELKVRHHISSLRGGSPRLNSTAQTPTPLVGDWQHWVSHNVGKGVVEQQLISMATQSVRAAWSKRMSELRVQSESAGYTYEKCAALGSVVQTHDRAIPVLMDMDQPRIVLFGGVLSKEECEAIIAMAQPRMTPSVTMDNATAQAVVTQFRTSNGTFLKLGETPFVERIEQRIADLTRWPVEKGEGLQVLQYAAGGEYVPHFDFFPPEQPGSLPMLQHGGQRVATLIVYLKTVEEGGETIFPKLNLKIKPVQGNALYFSYGNSKNELDRLTLHGGSPVIQGEKWIMTKWMRQDAINNREVMESKT